MFNHFPLSLLLLLLLFTSAPPLCHSYLLVKRQVCDSTWALCFPVWNSTIWYQNNTYTFLFNQNNTFFMNNGVAIFDLHLLTNNNNNNNTEERTMKSWYNLTTSDLTVQVTDDWFPAKATIKNTTWIMYAYLLPHNTILPPNLDLSATQLNPQDPYVQFKVVQLPLPMVREEKVIVHRWIFAIIMIACVLVILALILVIWFYKNMQKAKKKQLQALQQVEEMKNNDSSTLLSREQQQQQQQSILSTKDAVMIVDTFRQAMMSPSPSQQEIAEEKKRLSQDLLYRQLQSEQGTSVLEVERRTSSTKSVSKKKIK